MMDMAVQDMAVQVPWVCVPLDAVPLVCVRKVHDVCDDRESAEEEERDQDGAVADVRDAARDAEAEETKEDRNGEDDCPPVRRTR